MKKLSILWSVIVVTCVQLVLVVGANSQSARKDVRAGVVAKIADSLRKNDNESSQLLRSYVATTRANERFASAVDLANVAYSVGKLEDATAAYLVVAEAAGTRYPGWRQQGYLGLFKTTLKSALTANDKENLVSIYGRTLNYLQKSYLGGGAVVTKGGRKNDAPPLAVEQVDEFATKALEEIVPGVSSTPAEIRVCLTEETFEHIADQLDIAVSGGDFSNGQIDQQTMSRSSGSGQKSDSAPGSVPMTSAFRNCYTNDPVPTPTPDPSLCRRTGASTCGGTCPNQGESCEFVNTGSGFSCGCVRPCGFDGNACSGQCPAGQTCKDNGPAGCGCEGAATPTPTPAAATPTPTPAPPTPTPSCVTVNATGDSGLISPFGSCNGGDACTEAQNKCKSNLRCPAGKALQEASVNVGNCQKIRAIDIPIGHANSENEEPLASLSTGKLQAASKAEKENPSKDETQTDDTIGLGVGTHRCQATCSGQCC